MAACACIAGLFSSAERGRPAVARPDGRHDAVADEPIPPPRERASRDWHTLTGPDRSFTADLPAAPNHTTTQMRLGCRLGLHACTSHRSSRATVAYVVQTAVYPADVDVSNHARQPAGRLDNAAKNMEGGKWASVGWVTHQGLTAVDAVGVRDGLAVRSFRP